MILVFWHRFACDTYSEHTWKLVDSVGVKIWNVCYLL